jgi:hypothetical protein
MKIKTFFFELLFLILLVGCAVTVKFSDSQKEKMLRKTLEQWEHFRLDGIIEMNYQSFSFRKNITVRKNSERLRLDIYDAGVLGLHPTPFISVSVDSVIIVKMPGTDELTELTFPEFWENEIIANYLNFDSIFSRKAEIFKEKKTKVGKLTYFFSERMVIERIASQTFSFTFSYDNSQNPTTIYFYTKGKEIAEIKIDEISYEIPEIQSLK